METADEVSWFGDSKIRFLERAASLDQWDKDNDKPEVGKNFIRKVIEAVNDSRIPVNNSCR